MSIRQPDPLHGADLVVLSHLQWSWVWQRPQHLVSRLAAQRRASGGRTWFVEEPVAAEVAEPSLQVEQVDGITRVWLEVPRRSDGHLSFGAPGSEGYGRRLQALLGPAAPDRDVWLYTPMAYDIAVELAPRLLVYDVMDDLAAFTKAPQGLRLRQRAALRQAGLVFAGGRSLHEMVRRVRGDRDTHLFPSGVETAHYERARRLRRPQTVPVAGYVGVVDERLDLDLLAGLAAALPGWELQVVGPVSKAKLDPAALPQAPNLRYLGMRPYAELPELMAGFDVALMPFARNQATRSISPTKTLEYLAAGLPVVSTRIPDVLADFGDVVHLADTAAEFAAACREVAGHSRRARDALVAPIRARHEWDAIAAAMSRLMAAKLGLDSRLDQEVIG